MLKDKDYIKVRLTTYGTLEVVCIPVNLNKDSYNNVRLQCLVPKTENSTDDAILKVYSSTFNPRGDSVWTSQTYQLPFKNFKTIRGYEYLVFEDDFPREFCTKNGDLTLTFSYCTISSDGTLTSLLPSQDLNLYIGFVGGKGFNENGIKISDYDATVANINRLNKQIATKAEIDEVFLRYNIENLPNKIFYEKEGYKTPIVIYENAVFNISNIDYKTTSQKGSLIVTSTIKEDEIVQVETFIFKDNIAQRTLILSNNKERLSASEWSIKVDRKQDLSHVGEFLYVDKNGNVNFTKALKDFITKADGEILTNDTSTYDFSSIFEIIKRNKEEVVIDGSAELKTVLKNAEYDISTGRLKLARYNKKEFILQFPTKLSQFQNDTKYITKEVDNLSNYTLTDSVGNKLTFLLDQKTYVLTINLLNPKNEIISTASVDLPLESMIVDGRYENGYVYLMLKSGTEIRFSIAALISGLVPSTRKINGQTLDRDVTIFIPTKLSELSEDTSHRTVTDEEKALWNNRDYNTFDNLPIIPPGVEIVDNCDSTAREKSLSARQGKILKEAIDSKLNKNSDIEVTGVQINNIPNLGASSARVAVLDGANRLHTRTTNELFNDMGASKLLVDGVRQTSYDLGQKVARRISGSLYAENSHYHKLCNFPKSDGANSASLFISGEIGGYETSNKSIISTVLSNRGGVENIPYLQFGTSNLLKNCDIEMYQNEDETVTAYLVGKGYYTFDLTITAHRLSYLYNGTYSETQPTGELIWSASTAENSFKIDERKAYINDKKLLVEGDPVWSLSTAEEIPSDADLNDYKEIGNYQCSGDEKTSTLKNLPEPNMVSFSMKVSQPIKLYNLKFRLQEITSYHGSKFIREYNGDHNTWKEWKRITDNTVLSEQINNLQSQIDEKRKLIKSDETEIGSAEIDWKLIASNIKQNTTYEIEAYDVSVFNRPYQKQHLLLSFSPSAGILPPDRPFISSIPYTIYSPSSVSLRQIYIGELMFKYDGGSRNLYACYRLLLRDLDNKANDKYITDKMSYAFTIGKIYELND